MESKPNYLLVGSFVVVGIAFIFATMIWLVRTDFDVDYAEYEILISGSVSGLSVAGDVRFNGIPVGQVKSIEIYAEDPQLVRVIIAVNETVPITVDAFAKVEVQGLTGVSFIEITGGTDERLLIPLEGRNYARIPSRLSTIQGLLTDIPAALGEVRDAAEMVKVLLNPQNQELLAQLLTNLVTISDDVAAISGDTAGNIFTASASMVNASAETEQILVAARAFSVGTLPEISSLVVDLRRLSSVLTDIATEFDQNPTEALFGSKYPEYLPE